MPDPVLDQAIVDIKADGEILHQVVHGLETDVVTLEDGGTLKSLRNILKSNALITSSLENEDESTTFIVTDDDGITTFGEATLNNNLYVTNGTVKIEGEEVWHPGNDGALSGLDADKLDGFHATYFTNAANINTGILPPAQLSGSYPISVTGSAATLTNARNIALTGDVVGTASFNGSANATIATTIANPPVNNFSERYFESLSDGYTTIGTVSLSGLSTGTDTDTHTLAICSRSDAGYATEAPNSNGIVANDAGSGISKVNDTTLEFQPGTYYIDASVQFVFVLTDIGESGGSLATGRMDSATALVAGTTLYKSSMATKLALGQESDGYNDGEMPFEHTMRGRFTVVGVTNLQIKTSFYMYLNAYSGGTSQIYLRHGGVSSSSWSGVSAPIRTRISAWKLD